MLNFAHVQVPFDVAHGGRCLVFVDDLRTEHVGSLLAELASAATDVHVQHLGDATAAEWPPGPVAISYMTWNLARITELLQLQPIGTKVYIAAAFEIAVELHAAAVAAGFAEEDIQVRYSGRIPVFCAACYTVQPDPGTTHIRCSNCGRDLAVSAHYSPRWRAVLGYVRPSPERRKPV